MCLRLVLYHVVQLSIITFFAFQAFEAGVPFRSRLILSDFLIKAKTERCLLKRNRLLKIFCNRSSFSRMFQQDRAQEEVEFYQELNFFIDINKDNIFELIAELDFELDIE